MSKGKLATDERFNVIWDRLGFTTLADSLTTVVMTQDTFKEALKGSGLLSCWENGNKKNKKKTQRAGTEPLPFSLTSP